METKVIGMSKLTRADLWSLEDYSEQRPAFRARVIAHKKHRQVALTEHARLYFEDALTIQYQIQEMLRIEKVFESHGIQEELDAYNPLIPDGCNWKATFMLEYADVEERRQRVQELLGVEDKVWVQVAGNDKVFAIADEDLPREDDVKTSTVHFLRFELTPGMVHAAKAGAAIRMGVDHPNLTAVVEVGSGVRESLVADLQESRLN